VRVSSLGPEAKKKAKNIPPDFNPARPSWLIIYLIKYKGYKNLLSSFVLRYL